MTELALEPLYSWYCMGFTDTHTARDQFIAAYLNGLAKSHVQPSVQRIEVQGRANV